MACGEGRVWCAGRGVCGGGVCVAGGVHGRGRAWHACPPADTTRYGDTVNERAIRILLECILVEFRQLQFDKSLSSSWISSLDEKDGYEGKIVFEVDHNQ